MTERRGAMASVVAGGRCGHPLVAWEQIRKVVYFRLRDIILDQVWHESLSSHVIESLYARVETER